VLQLTAYGAVVSGAPRFTPLSVNCTDATPTLSEALADTLIVPLTVAPDPGDVSETLGAEVSETALLTVIVRPHEVCVFPAASCATARSV
jgi:hypothetical protein